MKIHFSLWAFTCMGFLFSTAMTHAQNRDMVNKFIVSHSQEISYHMADKYRLDSVKQKQVEKVFIEYYTGVDSLRTGSGKAEKESAYKDLVKRRDDALKEIFQDKKWKRFQADLKNRRSHSPYENKNNKQSLRK